LAAPQQGRKTNDIISSPNHVLYISRLFANVTLDLFHCFRRFGVFFGLVFHFAFDKKGNAVPMQTEVIFFGRVKTSQSTRK